MRKSMPLFARVLALLVLLVVAACIPDEGEPLRVGTIHWPGTEPLFLARELGLFEDRSVHLVEYASLGALNRALRNGMIDAAHVTFDMALVLQQHGLEPRVVLAPDYSHGGDAIVARPDVRRLEDLRGQRIAVEDLTTSPYVLGRALDRAGLNPSDVEIVRIPVNRQQRAYEEGEVDAVVTFEPFVDKLLDAGAHTLFDSSQLPEEILDVVVVREDSLGRRSRQVRHLLQGWFQALDYLKRNPDNAVARMSPRLGMSPSEFVSAMQSLRWLSLDDNLALLGGSSPAIVDQAHPLQRHMQAQGLLSEPVRTQEMLDARFLEELHEGRR
jgi:NitT/TauT family transport system substrate-binding protein